MNPPQIVQKLARDHRVLEFDCGNPVLNEWFQRFALANQAANMAQTYVYVADQQVVGFYSLASGQVNHQDAPERLRKGVAQHPIPIMLMARLAVDGRWQGQGFGAALVKDAALRTLQAADIGGIRGLAVHAKDDAARKFYERFDFVPSPTDHLHLVVLLKDLRGLLAQ